MNQKKGLDYFPMDIDFFQDEKIQFVSARFGTRGEAITVRLLCKIYRNGYYMDWDDDIALLFAKGVGDNCQDSCVKDVVFELLKRGFFNRSIFERFSILTSIGIQKRYFEATIRRKSVQYDPRFILIDLEKYNNLYPIQQNADIQNQNVYILNENEDILKQSKVKKSKVLPPYIPPGGEKPKKEKRFVKPTVEEVAEYCRERNNGIDAAYFRDFYQGKGWMVGKSPMKDWKACVRTWEKNHLNNGPPDDKPGKLLY